MTPGEPPWNLKRLLEWTTAFFTRKQIDSPRLSAEMLLAHVLGVPRVRLYTDFERVPGPAQLERFRDLVRRAGTSEPIAYLTGSAPFFNLELHVAPAVLIPRPDSETLVEHVVQLARSTPGFQSPRILDLCTGSGCIALALARALKAANLVATDISPQALTVARANAVRLGLDAQVAFLPGDLYAALDGTPEAMPFDLVLANPPYIPSADIQHLDPSVRDFEPRLALDGGPDGLDLIRRILTGSRDRLRPGGRLFVEMQFDQAEAVLALLTNCPWLTEPRVLRDAAGHQRVLTANCTS